jgi:hypothetical protein
MPASRGDRKPCTADGCTGTMQFGRLSNNEPATAAAAATRGVARPKHDPTGWVCSKIPAHFRQSD